MIKREVIWDNVDGDAMIWCQDNENAEVTCISGDKVTYYVPDELLDSVWFYKLMKSMKIEEKDRHNIRNYIKELWDEFNK